MRDAAELSDLLLGDAIDVISPRTRLTDKDALALAKNFDEEMYPRAFGESVAWLGWSDSWYRSGTRFGMFTFVSISSSCRLGQGERDRRERRYDRMVRIPQDVPLPERGTIGRARRHVEGQSGSGHVEDVDLLILIFPSICYPGLVRRSSLLYLLYLHL